MVDCEIQGHKGVIHMVVISNHFRAKSGSEMAQNGSKVAKNDAHFAKMA